MNVTGIIEDSVGIIGFLHNVSVKVFKRAYVPRAKVILAVSGRLDSPGSVVL